MMVKKSKFDEAAYQKAYRKRHKRRLDEYHRLYYIKNKERLNVANRTYYHKNKHRTNKERRDAYKRDSTTVKLSNAKYRLNNMDKLVVAAVTRRQMAKKRLVERFGNVCFDCKMSYPIACYDFHHKRPANKKFGLANLKSYTWKIIMQEARKCVMLCANCHRIRHSKENSHKN